MKQPWKMCASYMNLYMMTQKRKQSIARAYRQTSNIRRSLVGNKLVDHSNVVGTSPVGATPTISSFSTWHLASMDCANTTERRDEKHLSFGIWCALHYYTICTVILWDTLYDICRTMVVVYKESRCHFKSLSWVISWKILHDKAEHVGTFPRI